MMSKRPSSVSVGRRWGEPREVEDMDVFRWTMRAMNSEKGLGASINNIDDAL
jgi:hypothetical protein